MGGDVEHNFFLLASFGATMASAVSYKSTS
jgi:hypothetical protein